MPTTVSMAKNGIARALMAILDEYPDEQDEDEQADRHQPTLETFSARSDKARLRTRTGNLLFTRQVL